MSVISSFWCWSVMLVCMSKGVFTRSRESGRVVHLVNNNVPSFLYFNTAPGDTSRTSRRQDNTEIIELLLYPSKPIQVERRAAVVLSGEAEGTLSFVQRQPPIGEVVIEGVIRNLTPGLHGFHIHTLGDITGGCGSTGGHYNPYNRSHGGPTDRVRHIGDLGNIEADSQGVAYVNITDTTIRLVGPRSIVGRSIVIHSAEDDLGRGESLDSAKTGNAGGRVGCGVIGFA